jgi:hypothetical protein
MAEWIIDPHFLDLSTSWRSMVSFTPRPLNPGNHWVGGWVSPSADLDGLEKINF